MKKALRNILIFFVIMILLFIVVDHFGGYRFETDIECINSKVPETEQVRNVVFKYENDKQEIIMYQSESGTFWTGLLDKKTVDGSTLYKFNNTATKFPSYLVGKTRTLGCFKYVAIDVDEKYYDISYYDFGEYTPQQFEIEYTSANGIKWHEYLYIADTLDKNSKTKS